MTMLDAAATSQRVVQGDRTPGTVDADLHRAFGFRVHQIVAERAARTPDAIAVEHGEARLTYRELDRRADRVAGDLRALGIGMESRVGIFMERSLDLIVGLVGILKACAAYLPLDPSYPRDRLAYYLEDSQANVVVTQRSLVDTLPPTTAQMLVLDGAPPRSQTAPLAPRLEPVPIAGRDDAGASTAYVIYTSGSTGRPKGVLVPHRALANHAQAVAARFGLTGSDRVLQFASISFDVAAEELFPTWLAGGTVVLRPDEIATSPDELQRFARQARLTVLNLPTSYWQTWLEELERSGADIPPTVRLVVVGSDRALPSHLARWKQHVGERVRWLNAYGPTEATITSTVYEPTPGAVERPDCAVSIGRAIDGACCYVLNDALQPVPAGATGELFIGGAGLTTGYLDHPDLTASAFVPDPYSDTPGARLYRTGDLARVRDDGNLEFLGRADDQVKIRGFRIELGEIEAALGRAPGVQECVVTAQSDTGGEPRLTAYVVGRPGADLSARALRDVVRQHLPAYMAPAAYVGLVELPLTPSGKVDRRALPSPDQGLLTDEGDEIAEPRTATEAALAAILADLLGVERIDLRLSFYDLGGHSLLAARVVARASEALGTALTIRDLFEAPSIAELAARLDRSETGSATASTTGFAVGPIARSDRTGRLPLSFAQERLWLLDQLEPGSPLYNLAFAVRLDGLLDAAALETSLDVLVRRHEALRTTFGAVDGRPFQVVRPPASVGMETVDLTGLDADEREIAVERLGRDEAVRPFSLAHDPLFRARLLRLAPRQHVLLLTMHHIVSDGWSMEILLREIAALYHASAGTDAIPVQDLPIQYGDFAVWQRQTVTDEAVSHQLDTWRAHLAGAPSATELQTDRPRPARQTFRGAIHAFVLPASLRDRLERVARAEGVTPYMLLLAAYASLLHQYTGQDDLVIGSPSAGRTCPEIEGLIGFFVNTLPLRIDLSGAPSFRELLSRVRDVALLAQANQDVPLERLIEAIPTERDPSRNPLIQVVLAYLHDGLDPIELPELTLRAEELHTGTARFDLTLFLERTTSGLIGRIEYNTDLFDPDSMERLAAHLQTLLEGVAADPGQPVAELPLMTAPERARLAAWNETDVPLADERLVHRRVEAVATVSPDRLAIVSPSASLTYDDLNRRANQLAHYLQTLDVGPERRVGICLERSTDLIVAELAVLKAGGAYVPLDPAYPDERRSFMLADAGVAAFISRSELLTTDVPASGPPTVLIDRDRERIAQQPEHNPSAETGPSSLAYVIYTSGSTGLPKGTLIGHHGLTSLVNWHQRTFEITDDDRFTLLAGPAFDASVWEIWSHLTVGAVLMIPDDETRGTPAGLRDWMVREQITMTFLPTPLAEAMLALDWPADTSLRIMLTGGDTLHQPPRSGLPFALVNNYGPTESTVVTTSGLVPSAAGPAGTPPSIGRPIDNIRVYIVDRRFRRVPIGVAGELCVGGVGLARGYLGRPDLTADRFVPDSFGGEPGARLYRTGDLARYLADGTIEFLGRLDHQVKLRGFRIEPGEIEAVLARHPAIGDCTVLAREDEPGQKRLVAYVVPAGADRPDIVELRTDLREHLPEYMVPASFVVLDELPLTPNGKIDRRALPAPADDALAVDFVAPRGATEQAIAAIWADILSVQRVSATSGFFLLGGHSLLATRVVARVREQLHADIPLRALFEAPTLADFARVVEQARIARPATPEPSIGPAARAAHRIRLTARL